MATVDKTSIHGCKKISASEESVYSETLQADVKWITISFDDYDVTVFDRDLEDLRAALYRADMEVYDANSANTP